MTETRDDIPAIPAFPFPTDPLVGVPPEYAERRTQCPLGRVRLTTGDPAVLLVTYQDIAAAVNEPRLTHNLSAAAGTPRMTAAPNQRDDPDSVLNQDGEPHLRLRRIVAAAFNPRGIEQRKPTITAVATELLDALEKSGPPADIVGGYAIPLPIRVICKLLGVPEQDAAQFREWSDAVVSSSPMTPEHKTQLLGEFAQYVAALIARKRAEPGDDLIDVLIAARDGEDRLSEGQLRNLVLGLIAAGNETTANVLSKSMLSLLKDGGVLWRQLADHPELLPTAVDELLRHTSLGVGGTLRLALEDVELPSGIVKAGETVVIPTIAGKRDREAYPDPDTVRFDRTDLPVDITFGGGAHYCLGVHLAKAELQIGLGLALQRFPSLRLETEPGQLRFTTGEILNSLVALPVSW
jgi:cytochrome P450